MFKIGNLEIKNKVVLAPMAGITSFSYRKFMAKFGVTLTYTEMISDMGLIFNNQETKNYLDFPKEDFITGVQLFGHDPNNIAKSVQIVEKHNQNFDFFDVNMACPVLKVTRQGSGSTLMKDPKKCGEIIKAIKAVTNKPVTAKIRLGFDNSSINFLEVIKALEEAGIDLIAIHARTAKQLYSGEPNFEIIRDLRKKMNVPLIVSGNIYSIDDAVKALEITGADAVMVARGGVGNPFLIKQLNHYFSTGKILPNPTLEEQKQYCLELAEELIKEKGEEKAMRIYRGIASKFFNGFANSKNIRLKLSNELVSFQHLKDILAFLK